MFTQTLVGIAVGAVLGWLLKYVTDSWSWRRQQVLDAHLAVLDAADLAGSTAAASFGSGTDLSRRDEVWRTGAREARNALFALDRACGRLRLVGSRKTAEATIDLYVACERLFRQAISVPPTSAERYEESSREMAHVYDAFIEVGRKELMLRQFRERFLPAAPSIYHVSKRKLEELNETDPIVGRQAKHPADESLKS